MRGRGERRRVAEVQRRGRLRRTGGGRGEDQEERGASKREREGVRERGGKGREARCVDIMIFFGPGIRNADSKRGSQPEKLLGNNNGNHLSLLNQLTTN